MTVDKVSDRAMKLKQVLDARRALMYPQPPPGERRPGSNCDTGTSVGSKNGKSSGETKKRRLKKFTKNRKKARHGK